MSRHRLALLLSALLTILPAAANDLADARAYLRQGQADKALQKADSWLGSKEYVKKHFGTFENPKPDSWLASRPRDAQGRLVKGAALAQQGRAAEAIQIYQALIRDYPTLPEPRNNLAAVYASQGQYEQAAKELEAALRTHSSYAAAHANLAELYTRMAAQAYDKALGNNKAAPAPVRLAMLSDVSAPGTAPASSEPTVVVALAPTKPVAPPAASAPPPPAPTPPAKPVEPPKPTAKPAESAKPAEPTKPAKPAKEDNDADAVLAAVNAWAKAWSAKNVGGYLGSYAKSFTPPKGESRSAWEKARKERITAPKNIKVTVTGAKVRMKDDTHASVTFRQGYDADHLSTSATKTLDMVKVGKRWLIEEERIGR